MMDVDRIPADINAERAVLGIIMVQNAAYDRVYDLIGEQDFYRSDHRQVWCAVSRLIEKNKPADVITVADALQAAGQLEDMGGLSMLGAITAAAPAPVNVRAHATIVRERAILRRLAAAAMDIGELARQPGIEAAEAAEQAEAKVLGVLDADSMHEQREPETLHLISHEAADWLDSDRTAGIPTGYGKLDAMLCGGGLQPEQLVIIAGRPSMGKSALAWCIAENASRTQTVAYFALEMSRRELGVRSLRWHQSLTSRLDALKHMSEAKLLIDDTAAIGLSAMRIKLRRIRRKRGLGLVVVDYMQLMSHRAESRLQEVSAISRGLKAIAKEFAVPVLAVAQLNRGAENRTDQRPMLADLRESGQLEQDADVVMMVYRDDYYRPETHLKGFGEILIRKNRDGAVGDVLLKWVPEHTRWIDHHGPWPEKPEEQKQGQQTVRQFRPRTSD